ncbi:MAG: hypothetical protein MZV64_21645 [Ignavibacteriales bacterium]|nr:hypothetical protein [Ignavibacteriales bacterium]
MAATARRVGRQRRLPLRCSTQPAVGGVIVGARLGERAHLDDNARLSALRARRARTARALPTARGCAHADPRRLRRRVPQAAVPHRARRPEPSPRRLPRAVRGRARTADGAARALQRHRLGDALRATRAPCASATASSCPARRRPTATVRSGGRDAAAQAHLVIDKIEGAIAFARRTGSRTWCGHASTCRTPATGRRSPVRMGRGSATSSRRNTLAHAGLVGSAYLVEMEAEALVRPPR